jgi:trehalose 6-phosphate phosphatase
MSKNAKLKTRSSEPPVAENPLFFLDYDGTLAPIVEDPMQAHPHEDAPDLLRRLEEQHPVYLVTGRHLRDLAVLMPDPALEAIGLHGTQQGTVGGAIRDLASEEARRALDERRAAVPDAEGLVVEDKGRTFAVHYREADNEAAVREQLRSWVEDAAEDLLEAIWGKKNVELRPAGTSKGVAVRRVTDEHPERTPLYLGDDVTDEDAFAALEDDPDAVTVKVGGGETRARYRLDGPDEVIAYLRRYVA